MEPIDELKRENGKLRDTLLEARDSLVWFIAKEQVTDFTTLMVLFEKHPGSRPRIIEKIDEALKMEPISFGLSDPIEKVTCPTCQGQKRIAVPWDYTWNNPDGTMPCPNCEGTGYQLVIPEMETT